MSQLPDHITIERRPSGPWPAAAMVGVGLAIAVACVLWAPGVFWYLVGLGLAALAALRVVFLLLRGRARVLGAMGIMLILAAAILTPWQLAEAERSGSPRWRLKTDDIAHDLFVDGRRLLFSDDSGLHALDLTTGSILWSFDSSPVYTLHVAADGHVLIQSGPHGANEFVWLSPDGDLLWRSVEDADGRYLMGLDFEAPLASSNGVLVVARCAGKPGDKNWACTYVGVGPDGRKRWEAAGYEGVTRGLELQQSGSEFDDPERLPTVAVVDSRPDEGGEALVVNANDGATIAEVDIKQSLAVTGQTVVYESGPADSDGTCRSHGLSRDGKVDWSAKTPCLHGSTIVLGDRLYGSVGKGPYKGGGDHPLDDCFMIDTATGNWKMVGPLEQFNHDSDGRVAVPGADIVVQRDTQHLTGVDPDTGDVMWDLTAPGDDVPDVSSAHGAAVVLASPGRGHNPFYAGDERRTGETVLVIDTASGDVTGKRTLPDDTWNAIPTGPGQAVLVDGEELSLIGSDPDAR